MSISKIFKNRTRLSSLSCLSEDTGDILRMRACRPRRRGDWRARLRNNTDKGAKTANRNVMHQPQTLEKLAMTAAGGWFAGEANKILIPEPDLDLRNELQIEQLFSSKIEMMRNFVERKIPGIFHTTLLYEVIRALLCLVKTLKTQEEMDKFKNRIGCRMIEALFTKNVTSINIQKLTWDWFQESFYTQSHLLTGITEFEVHADLEEANIIRLVKELYGLKSLNLDFSQLLHHHYSRRAF